MTNTHLSSLLLDTVGRKPGVFFDRADEDGGNSPETERA